MQHLQPNTTLQGGKYRIERVLGQGLRGRLSDFPPRPNGSLLPVGELRVSPTSMQVATISDLLLGMLTIVEAPPMMLDRRLPMNWDFTICVATYWNGAPTGTADTPLHLRTIRLVQVLALTVYFVVVAGTSLRGTVECLAGTATHRRGRTSVSASALPYKKR